MKIDYCFALTGDPKSMEQSLSVQMTMINFMQQGKLIGLKAGKSCNIYVARNGCLSDGSSRKDQKPFEGIYDDYDRIIWVDSDNLINAEVVQKLIDHDVDIVAAWYRQYSKGDLSVDNKVACGRGTEAFRVKDMPNLERNEKGLVEVDYAGLGCMVVKRGVFEALTYPWFTAWTMEWEENGIQMADIETDDAGFCHRAKQAGFKIWIDPELQILHQKLVDL
jgi:hypothetical protein